MRIPNVSLKKAGKFILTHITSHRSEILTSFAVGGVVTTAVFTYKATIKAQEYINANCDENSSDDTRTVVKQKTYKFYIPAAMAGAMTIGCIVGSEYLNRKKITALAAACTVAETALNENRAKIEELLGVKELDKLDDAMNVDHATNAVSEGTQIIDRGHGTVLCCEGYLTGQLFRANKDFVLHALNLYNDEVNNATYAEFADFLDYLDIIVPEVASSVGHNVHTNGVLRLHWTTDIYEPTGEPMLIFKPSNAPIHAYGEIL